MTEPTPDHVPCRHCGVPISWDEMCWTHDDTGFADCGLVISGGTHMISGGVVGIVNPTLTITRTDGAKAEPEGDWS